MTKIERNAVLEEAAQVADKARAEYLRLFVQYREERNEEAVNIFAQKGVAASALAEAIRALKEQS